MTNQCVTIECEWEMHTTHVVLEHAFAIWFHRSTATTDTRPNQCHQSDCNDQQIQFVWRDHFRSARISPIIQLLWCIPELILVMESREGNREVHAIRFQFNWMEFDCMWRQPSFAFQPNVYQTIITQVDNSSARTQATRDGFSSLNMKISFGFYASTWNVILVNADCEHRWHLCVCFLENIPLISHFMDPNSLRSADKMNARDYGNWWDDFVICGKPK